MGSTNQRVADHLVRVLVVDCVQVAGGHDEREQGVHGDILLVHTA